MILSEIVCQSWVIKREREKYCHTKSWVEFWQGYSEFYKVECLDSATFFAGFMHLQYQFSAQFNPYITHPHLSPCYRSRDSTFTWGDIQAFLSNRIVWLSSNDQTAETVAAVLKKYGRETVKKPCWSLSTSISTPASSLKFLLSRCHSVSTQCFAYLEPFPN